MQKLSLIRISKFIAKNSGYSRRKAEDLIKNKQVLLNGERVSSPATMVSPQDNITIKSESIIANLNAKLEVWLLNKPRGVLTTKQDPQGRTTIYDILPHHLENILYVGRLDYNSEGLIVLTNSGKLVNFLTSARNQIIREYKVKTFGHITQQQLDRLKHGVTINKVLYDKVFATIVAQKQKQTWIQFIMYEGKNKEIRILCKSLGLQVSKLIRTKFDQFNLKMLGDKKLIKVPQRLLAIYNGKI